MFLKFSKYLKNIEKNINGQPNIITRKMDVEKRIRNIENNFSVFLKLLAPDCSNKVEVTKVASNFNSLVEISEQSEPYMEKIRVVHRDYLKIIKDTPPKMYPLLEKELKNFS